MALKRLRRWAREGEAEEFDLRCVSPLSTAWSTRYFRIFNPILQAQKFDPDGSYIHRYVPELAQLPAKYLSAPWDAPKHELAKAGVRLGETYPRPIVDHQQARTRALDALQSLNTAAETV